MSRQNDGDVAVATRPERHLGVAPLGRSVQRCCSDLAESRFRKKTSPDGGDRRRVAASRRRDVEPRQCAGYTLCVSEDRTLQLGGRLAEAAARPRRRCHPRRFDAATSPAVPVRLVAERAGDGWQIAGLPVDVAGVGSMLLVADPFTFSVDALLEQLGKGLSDLAVVGAASARMMLHAALSGRAAHAATPAPQRRFEERRSRLRRQRRRRTAAARHTEDAPTELRPIGRHGDALRRVGSVGTARAGALLADTVLRSDVHSLRRLYVQHAHRTSGPYPVAVRTVGGAGLDAARRPSAPPQLLGRRSWKTFAK